MWKIVGELRRETLDYSSLLLPANQQHRDQIGLLAATLHLQGVERTSGCRHV